MHSVLFSVVCIERGGEAKALYSSVHKYTYMHLRMCVER